MALNPPFVVRVEKKPDRSFGAIMNDIRTWLDHRRIEPVSFQPVARLTLALGLRSPSTPRMRPTFSSGNSLSRSSSCARREILADLASPPGECRE
jgi:hypothetical protein